MKRLLFMNKYANPLIFKSLLKSYHVVILLSARQKGYKKSFKTVVIQNTVFCVLFHVNKNKD